MSTCSSIFTDWLTTCLTVFNKSRIFTPELFSPWSSNIDCGTYMWNICSFLHLWKGNNNYWDDAFTINEPHEGTVAWDAPSCCTVKPVMLHSPSFKCRLVSPLYQFSQIRWTSFQLQSRWFGCKLVCLEPYWWDTPIMNDILLNTPLSAKHVDLQVPGATD